LAGRAAAEHHARVVRTLAPARLRRGPVRRPRLERATRRPRRPGRRVDVGRDRRRRARRLDRDAGAGSSSRRHRSALLRAHPTGSPPMKAALVAEYRKLISTRIWWILLLVMVPYLVFVAAAISATFTLI